MLREMYGGHVVMKALTAKGRASRNSTDERYPLPIRLEIPVSVRLDDAIMGFIGNLGYVAVVHDGGSPGNPQPGYRWRHSGVHSVCSLLYAADCPTRQYFQRSPTNRRGSGTGF